MWNHTTSITATDRQERVDIQQQASQHRNLHDLRICQAKHHRLVLGTCMQQRTLHILAELLLAIVAGDLGSLHTDHSFQGAFRVERGRGQVHTYTKWDHETHLWLHKGAVGEEGGQLGQTLSTTASHSHQQCIASGLLQYPANTGKVHDGVCKEHQIQMPATCSHIVLLLQLFQRFQQGIATRDGSVHRVRLFLVQESSKHGCLEVLRVHLHVQDLGQQLHLGVDKPAAVFSIHQTVVEHSKCLVTPQTHKVVHIWHVLGSGLAQPLEYLGKERKGGRENMTR